MGTRHTHRRVSDADACQTTVTLLWATRRGEPSSKPELICKAARGGLWGKRATRQRRGGGGCPHWTVWYYHTAYTYDIWDFEGHPVPQLLPPPVPVPLPVLHGLSFDSPPRHACHTKFINTWVSRHMSVCLSVCLSLRMSDCYRASFVCQRNEIWLAVNKDTRCSQLYMSIRATRETDPLPVSSCSFSCKLGAELDW